MNSYNVARFTAWNAILGGLAACATLALSVVVTGGDIEMVPHGSAMLALPAEGRDLFRWWMLADVLGFYLPFVAIGGYFVHTFREELGALREMIAIAVAVYIVCGIAGAVLQLSTIHPLAHVYASGDEGAKVAAGAVWTAIANATQNGFWWVEGPLVFFWTSIAARLLKKAGWHGSFLLHIVGWGFGVFFVFGFFPSLAAVTDAGETVGVLALPLWMLTFGWQLLRRAPALAVPTARPA
ncbi:hypothetical protein PQH03_23830 [Ralstonia insidiosa]|jgi:hypothetical protein|uniref:hypothetical protein n=1 Tax=Ralstonia TaxID=48736 RepID=UPI000664B390|nr:hypothetical protein [Ralstonia insidiosa]KMW44601.1 membrane protein [Ralstonia sp. MD27]MBX3775251.1 hypothetical protein [Ralstonia pickettii]NOZ17063.1 hypothetical protein [Betaproteobacteria bacterium]MBA9859427.1 hypothetical protein [Ralstonia insidiosa]MBA9872875.1 hypothetical protein [Ralstonia insidiosa]